MPFPRFPLQSFGLLLVAASLLGGCKKDPAPAAPAPPVVVPPVVPPPVPPAPAADTAQYGIPFGGVPAREDAVIYQVNIRAFSAGGNLAGVLARLDSIKALHVNVVYLMPIYPVGRAVGGRPAYNSPYAVADYRAVNPEFGSLTDLRALVDAAHARQMAVMLDWVPNHTAWAHPWVTQHPDWYRQDAAGNILAVSAGGNTFRDVAQLDFGNQAMRAAQIAALKSWVLRANVDGFRFDFADFQPADFWQQATDSLRAIRSHRLLLLAEGSRAGNFASGFDYNFGFGFYDALKRVYQSGASATTFDGLNAREYAGATGTQQVVRYTTNHDVNGSDGTPVALFGGDAGAMSAFVVAACYRSVPMVYNGQEAGMSRGIPFPFTTVKVNWNARPDITRAYRALLAARAGSPALRHGSAAPYSTADVCAFVKTAGTSQALVLANVRNATRPFVLPAALANTTWTDALTNTPLTLGTDVPLNAYEYRVLTR